MSKKSNSDEIKHQKIFLLFIEEQNKQKEEKKREYQLAKYGLN